MWTAQVFKTNIRIKDETGRTICTIMGEYPPLADGRFIQPKQQEWAKLITDAPNLKLAAIALADILRELLESGRVDTQNDAPIMWGWIEAVEAMKESVSP